MRIIYLHQYFTTPEMAGGTRSYGMAKRLVDMGHEVDIVTTWRERDFPGKDRWLVTREDGITVHWIGVPYSNEMAYRKRLLAFSKFAAAASARCSSIKGDIVFATSTPLTIALPAVYTSKVKKIPMVFEVRDLWPEIPIAVGAIRSKPVIEAARWLERFAYRNAKRIVALSDGIRDGIVASGYLSENIEVIPNCSDVDFFRVDPEKASELRHVNEWLLDRPLIIYTGAIGLINGLEYLVKLAASVLKIDPEIRFLVLGSGREEKKIRFEANRLGVMDNNFFMRPEIPKSQIPYWMSAANVSTSFVINKEILWNNSANKFFDSLAAGKPIMINYGGWQADVLRETGAGLVLSADDIRLAAKETVKAVRDKKWLGEAGKAAGDLAEARYGIDDLAQSLEAVLLKAHDR